MAVDRDLCLRCNGRGHKLVVQPAILHLGVVTKKVCDICGGSGYISIGFCRGCSRKGPWNLLKDRCIYCDGTDTVNLDMIPRSMWAFPDYWKIVYPRANF